MNTQIRTKVWGLMAVTMVSLVGVGAVSAAPPMPMQPRLRPLVPPPVVTPSVPRLGIMGHIQYNRGMVVDSVNPGSTAARIGLERGDKIVEINNRRINTDRSYQEALSHAVRFQRGFVDLTVVDVRTGRVAHRTGHLRTGSGPSLPRFNPHFNASVSAY